MGDRVMTMNAYNGALTRGVLTAIGDLESGTSAVAEVQAVLQRAIQRFENDGSGVADMVRLAEADLEGILLTMVFDEQVPAAVVRLDDLRTRLGIAPWGWNVRGDRSALKRARA